MSKYRKIDFSTAEFEALNNIVSTLNAGKLHGTLTKLIGKMERAMSPSTAEWDYKYSDALVDAQEILKDRLVIPAFSPLWAGKINKFLAANNIDRDTFIRACRYAVVAWKGPAFFDTIVYQTPKMAVMPIFAATKKPVVNKGYAANDTWDSVGERPDPERDEDEPF